MPNTTNPGFSIEEIQNLKSLCAQENRSFVYIDDENLPIGNDNEMVHIQFVGHYNKQEVIYDAILCTLQLHYSSAVYEAAEKEVMEHFPLYVPIESRDETYVENEAFEEEVEVMILEIIDELEENDEVKVSEYIEIDENFDFGIGLDVALYVPAFEVEVIEKFISDFNGGTLSLDPSRFSFRSEDFEE
jgi:hypothetical protein